MNFDIFISTLQFAILTDCINKYNEKYKNYKRIQKKDKRICLFFLAVYIVNVNFFSIGPNSFDIIEGPIF